MSVESLFSESLSEESNDSAEDKYTDEEEAEDSEEYVDLLWMFWDLMSFEHIHDNNAVIDHEVQSEWDEHMEWFLEELQMANEVDSTLSSSSPEDTCQCTDEQFSDSSSSFSSSPSYTNSSSQHSEGNGELESTDKSGETSESS